jgi:hypothetical protein
LGVGAEPGGVMPKATYGAVRNGNDSEGSGRVTLMIALRLTESGQCVRKLLRSYCE